MAEASLAAGTDCPDACFVALGPSASLIWPITDWWTAQVRGRSQLLFNDRVRARLGADLGQSLTLAPNLALELDLLIESYRGTQSEWSTSLHWYF
jgi:hypothetical protein